MKDLQTLRLEAYVNRNATASGMAHVLGLAYGLGARYTDLNTCTVRNVYSCLRICVLQFDCLVHEPKNFNRSF